MPLEFAVAIAAGYALIVPVFAAVVLALDAWLDR